MRLAAALLALVLACLAGVFAAGNWAMAIRRFQRIEGGSFIPMVSALFGGAAIGTISYAELWPGPPHPWLAFAAVALVDLPGSVLLVAGLAVGLFESVRRKPPG